MRADDITIDMVLIADTSCNGTHLIQVQEVTKESPARVMGKIIHIIKPEEKGKKPIKVGDERDYGVRNCYPESEIKRFLK